jgi:integrase
MNQNPSISELHAAANGIKHLTAEQLEELMTVAMKESARDHAMLLVIFHHALRASEAADLKLSDLNWSSMEITIARKKGSLKTVQQLVSQRGKPCLDEIKALRRWIAERNRTNEPTSFVFASQTRRIAPSRRDQPAFQKVRRPGQCQSSFSRCPTDR